MNKIDLDKPIAARFFLRGIRIAGKRIEQINIASGKTLDVDFLSDEEAVRYAKDIYLDYCGGVEGQGGEIELQEDQ